MRAIFFDLFETLVTHFDPCWAPPRLSIAERLGIEESDFARLWTLYDAAWQAGEITGYVEALAQLCGKAGHFPSSALLMQIESEYENTTSRVFAKIEPEIDAMVTTLKQLGLKLSVITNAGDLDIASWSDCRLATLFDDIVVSSQVKLLKRDPHIFRIACKRLGVCPTDSLFVDDGGGNELRAAEVAGLTPYWCTWFLDRWPEGIRPNGFRGDEWRQYSSHSSPYTRLAHPSGLSDVVSSM